MPHARRYNQDPRSWLFDFRDVFNILIDHGHEKVGNCPFGRICTFGFQIQNSLSTEGLPPTEAPSRGFAHGEARIFVDKKCYNSGESIVANYVDISGENVWIGILPSDVIDDFRNLPAGPDSQSDLLKEWSLSCGNISCHTWTRSGGLQFPTNQLEEGEYVIVVSGDGGSLEGQAAARFLVGGC